jgi:hypothetical protein
MSEVPARLLLYVVVAVALTGLVVLVVDAVLVVQRQVAAARLPSVDF